MGASHVLAPDEWVRRRADLQPAGADVVVDAVGSVLPEAIEAAAMGARVVLFGMNVTARPAVHQVEITEKGLTVVGAYITNFTFPQAIRLIESGALDLAPLVSDVLSLARVAEGMAALRSGRATKVVITP
jgi:threonine dehydrogenase-like Zn-dependent dehydrogenase